MGGGGVRYLCYAHPKCSARLPPPEQQVLWWWEASQCKVTGVLCNLLLQQLWGTVSQCPSNQLLKTTAAKDCLAHRTERSSTSHFTQFLGSPIIFHLRGHGFGTMFGTKWCGLIQTHYISLHCGTECAFICSKTVRKYFCTDCIVDAH